MTEPPPLPKPPLDSGQDQTFVRQAALASIACPGLVLVVEGLARISVPSLPEPAQILTKIGVGFFLLVLAATGAILGIFAHRGTRPRGKPIVRAQAFFGSICSCVLVLLIAAMAAQSWRRSQTVREEVADLRRTIRDAVTEQRRQLVDVEDPDLRDPVGKARALNGTLSKVRDKLTVVARQAPGMDGLTLSAASEYIAGLQKMTQDYENCLSLVQKAGVSDVSTVRERSDLGSRRLILRQFLDSNERLYDFVLHAEERMRAELNQKKVSESAQDKFLAGFRKGKPRHELVLKIRETDRRIGEAAMALMNLYDQNWGDWNYDAVSRRVIFQEEGVLQKFQSLIRQIQEAQAEQGRLQQSLASMSVPSEI